LQEHRRERDPVASAQPAAEVQAKKVERQTDDGHEIQSFRTLLNKLGTQCRNTCEFGEGRSPIEIIKVTESTPFQTKAFDLLETYCSQEP